MDPAERLLITVTTARASDGEGYVGVLSVGDQEAYRTIRTHLTRAEALLLTQRLLAEVLGGLMAGQEWSSAQEELGHAPRRTDLEFGLRTSPPEGES